MKFLDVDRVKVIRILKYGACCFGIWGYLLCAQAQSVPSSQSRSAFEKEARFHQVEVLNSENGKVPPVIDAAIRKENSRQVARQPLTASGGEVPLLSAGAHLKDSTLSVGNPSTQVPSGADLGEGVPRHQAKGLFFEDTDSDGGQLGGMVTIHKASNESDITHYVIYWGSSSITKHLPTPIATLAKTGRNLTYRIPENTRKGTAVTHLLVFTQNSAGEMPTGMSELIVEVGL